MKIMMTSGIPVGKEIEVSDTLPGIFLAAAHTRPVESIHVNGTANEINRATDEAIRELVVLGINFLVILIRRPDGLADALVMPRHEAASAWTNC